MHKVLWVQQVQHLRLLEHTQAMHTQLRPMFTGNVGFPGMRCTVWLNTHSKHAWDCQIASSAAETAPRSTLQTSGNSGKIRKTFIFHLNNASRFEKETARQWERIHRNCNIQSLQIFLGKISEVSPSRSQQFCLCSTLNILDFKHNFIQIYVLCKQRYIRLYIFLYNNALLQDFEILLTLHQSGVSNKIKITINSSDLIKRIWSDRSLLRFPDSL